MIVKYEFATETVDLEVEEIWGEMLMDMPLPLQSTRARNGAVSNWWKEGRFEGSLMMKR